MSTPSTFISFEEISRALPATLAWTEADLIAVGRRNHSPLSYIRRADRVALWRVEDVIAYFRKRYRNAPELVAQFERALGSSCVMTASADFVANGVVRSPKKKAARR